MGATRLTSRLKSLHLGNDFYKLDIATSAGYSSFTREGVTMTNIETKWDLSEGATRERIARYQTHDCLEADAPEAWERHPNIDVKVACLATVTEGKDAEFIQSLVKQFATGRLSNKQFAWVNRLYESYGSVSRGRRIIATRHKWSKVETVHHSNNWMLGTYSISTYYKCERCGLDGEQYQYNNYSGD